ncbi:MAG TPA: hypothetical protein VHH11_13820 [Gammaproteobacteria bacterium]|nr:hypothetical protein [Gammaproteobacteria bacterium]
MTGRRAHDRVSPRRLAPACFGAVTLPSGHRYWCAWRDARSVATSVPDGSGMLAPLPVVADVVAGLFGAFLRVETDPAVVAAQQWLVGNAPGRPVQRDDAAAAQYAAHAGIGQSAPAAPMGAPWWTSVLGVPWPPTGAQVRAAYRARVAAAHPDHPGGSAEAYQRVQLAHTAAQGWLAEQEFAASRR